MEVVEDLTEEKVCLFVNMQEVLGRDETGMFNLISSFVRFHLKKRRDINLDMESEVGGIVNDVFVDLLSREIVPGRIKNERAGKSLLDIIVRTKISQGLSFKLSQVKMTNPKKSADGSMGSAALTKALYFSRGAWEIDREDSRGAEAIEDERFYDGDDFVNRGDFHINPLLRGVVREGLEMIAGREYEDLLRVDGVAMGANQSNSVLAASYFNRIVSEKMSSIEEHTGHIKCQSHLLDRFFPEAGEAINKARKGFDND